MPLTSYADSIHSTHEPPNFCLLLMDQTFQCGVAGPSSYWNFPWPVIIHSHGCLPPHHLANSQSQCNKEGKQVKQFSFPLFCLSADGSNQQRVCERRGETPCECFIFHTFSPHIQSSLCSFSIFWTPPSSHALSHLPTLSPCPQLWYSGLK